MWHRTPRWILIGGAWLAFTAGFVNAIGYAGTSQRGVSHVTGQVTQLGVDVARGDVARAFDAATLLLAFFVGAVISGAIVRKPELADHRPYGAALVLEAVLLVVGAVAWTQQPHAGEVVVVVAMGLQNALASSYSSAVVRTTHVTGLVTDLGAAIGRALRGEAVERAKLRLLALLFGAFLVGGVGGGMAFAGLGVHGLLLPAAWVLAMAVSWRRAPPAAAGR